MSGHSFCFGVMLVNCHSASGSYLGSRLAQEAVGIMQGSLTGALWEPWGSFNGYNRQWVALIIKSCKVKTAIFPLCFQSRLAELA